MTVMLVSFGMAGSIAVRRNCGSCREYDVEKEETL